MTYKVRLRSPLANEDHYYRDATGLLTIEH
jgi:hypothetical protein